MISVRGSSDTFATTEGADAPAEGPSLTLRMEGGSAFGTLWSAGLEKRSLLTRKHESGQRPMPPPWDGLADIETGTWSDGTPFHDCQYDFLPNPDQASRSDQKTELPDLDRLGDLLECANGDPSADSYPGYPEVIQQDCDEIASADGDKEVEDSTLNLEGLDESRPGDDNTGQGPADEEDNASDESPTDEDTRACYPSVNALQVRSHMIASRLLFRRLRMARRPRVAQEERRLDTEPERNLSSSVRTGRGHLT